MKLLSYGLAVGLGYLLGRPDGRERLAQLGRQAADLTQAVAVFRHQAHPVRHSALA